MLNVQYVKTLENIRKTGTFIKKAPVFVSEKTISDFVRKNEMWINEALIEKKRKNELYSEKYINELFDKGNTLRSFFLLEE